MFSLETNAGYLLQSLIVKVPTWILKVKLPTSQIRQI